MIITPIVSGRYRLDSRHRCVRNDLVALNLLAPCRKSEAHMAQSKSVRQSNQSGGGMGRRLMKREPRTADQEKRDPTGGGSEAIRPYWPLTCGLPIFRSRARRWFGCLKNVMSVRRRLISKIEFPLSPEASPRPSPSDESTPSRGSRHRRNAQRPARRRRYTQ